MSFFGSMDISASGLAANRTRMDLISQNIANAETNGYKRKSLIVEEKLTSEKDFRKILNSKLKGTNTYYWTYKDEHAYLRVYAANNNTDLYIVADTPYDEDKNSITDL